MKLHWLNKNIITRHNLIASKILLKSILSSFLTVVKHKTDAVFLWTIRHQDHIMSNNYRLCFILQGNIERVG